jgi:hypothetical protein
MGRGNRDKKAATGCEDKGKDGGNKERARGKWQTDSRVGTATTVSPNGGAAMALVHNLGAEYILHLLWPLPWGAIALSSTLLGTVSRRKRTGATRMRGRGDTLAVMMMMTADNNNTPHMQQLHNM